MRFLKKHYEKLILSLVLLGLAAGAVWVIMSLQETKDALQGAGAEAALNRPYKPADMSATMSALDKLKPPPPLQLAGEHNLFNPVTWKQKYDRTLIKITSGAEEGPEALAIQAIKPLRFIIKYERFAQLGYSFKVTREAAINLADRKERSVYVSATSPKADFFTFKEVQGPPDNPTAVILEMNDTKELASVSPDKPFERVDGYAADMRYDLENRNFTDIRKNTIVKFAGDAYKVVAIEKNQVRLMANSNNKQTTRQWNAAP
jgi:hypothetical protein